MFRKPYIWLLCLAMPLFGQSLEEPFVLTPRDTGPDPLRHELFQELGEGFELLTETEILSVYFRDDRDVLAIEDKRNGYLWKTGLNIPFNRDIDDQIDEGADPLKLPPREDRLNTTYTGIANSLVSIEYYDGANNIKRIGSADYRDSRSELKVIRENPFRAELDVRFRKVDISFTVGIEIEEDELIFTIADHSLQGEDILSLSAINIAPFFGASGGRQLFWDPEEEEHSISVAKESPDGYAVVPDGSGALIRFEDNTSRLSEFVANIYGLDAGQLGLTRRYDDFSPPPKSSKLPLFGIVLGHKQNAIAGYASKADEYLQIISFPEERMTYYNQTYPQFVYNRLYFQVYNKNGDGYFRTLEERNHFEAEFRYRFLQGDAADYGGIAAVYREHLDNSGLLPENTPYHREARADIPLRIDFIMSDVRENIIGYRDEVTTTVEDTGLILKDLYDGGIRNISAGLIGYADGGTVFNKPGKLRLNGSVGSRREFKSLFSEMEELGIDLSFSNDYGLISDGQILPWGNALRGVSGWYISHRTFQANAPVNLFYYARPERVATWIESENEMMMKLGAGSHSMGGFPSYLFSDYSDNDTETAAEVILRYQELLERISGDSEINLYNPNLYLWKYTDRYLHMPVFSTQHLIETDTVPLLQMVLQGSMDLFARYANFSFSGTRDILRMIDYNVYPSFLLTKESAHLLLATNSAENYSSQYAIYRDLIFHVYGKVNAALREVAGARWVSRDVLAEGVILNSYDNGVKIVINYTKNPFRFGSDSVPAEEAAVFRRTGEE